MTTIKLAGTCEVCGCGLFENEIGCGACVLIGNPAYLMTAHRLYMQALAHEAESHSTIEEFTAEYAPTPEQLEADRARHELRTEDEWEEEAA